MATAAVVPTSAVEEAWAQTTAVVPTSAVEEAWARTTAVVPASAVEEALARTIAVGPTSAGEVEPLQVAIPEVTEVPSVVVVATLGARHRAEKGAGGGADATTPRAMAAAGTGARGMAPMDQAAPALPMGTAREKPSPRLPRATRGKSYRLWLR